MASKAYNIAFKLAAKLDKSYSHSFILAEEIASRTVNKLGRVVAAIGSAVLSASAIKDAVSVYQDFEQSMANTAAIAGVEKTSDAYIMLERAALDAGKATSKTAQESADALGYMSLAGWSAEDAVKGLMPILRLSEATGADLATTSDLVTDSMSALGLEVNDLNRYLDVAAKANNKSNQTATQLLEAYIGVGGVFNGFNTDIAESAALLGVLANRGIKGSEAGNKLSSTLINMTKKTGESAKAMDELGISAYDAATGKFKGITEVLLELNEATRLIEDGGRLTEEQRNTYLQMIGGKTQVDTLNALMSGLNTISAEGISELEALQRELENSGGSLNIMANAINDTITGAMARLGSAIEDLKINAVKQFAPYITPVIDTIAAKLPSITENVSELLKKAVEFGKKAWKAIEPMFTWIRKNPMLISKSIAAIGAAIATHKVVDGVMGMSKAFSLLPAVMNPAALIIAGITGVIGALVVATSEANRKARLDNLAAHFGNVSLSLAEAEEVAKSIVRTENLNKVSEALSAFNDLGNIEESIDSAVDELNKINWKVSIGLELTQSEMEVYQENIETFISGAQELILQKQYAVNLALGVLVRGDTEEGNDIVGWVNKYYSAYYQDVATLGEKLSDTVNKAFADGVLDPEEIEKIIDIQAKIAEIEKKFASANYEAKLQMLKINASGAELTPESFNAVQQALGVEVSNAVKEYDEALELSVQTAILMHGDTWIDSEDFEMWIATTMEGYYVDVGEILVKASGFQVETINEAYGEELNAALAEFSPAIVEAANNMVKNAMANGEFTQLDIEVFMSDIKELKGLDPVTKANLASLYAEMAPTLQQYKNIKESCEKYGVAIPTSISQGILDLETIGTLAGSGNAIFTLLGALVGEDNPKFSAMIAEYVKAGGRLPDEFATGVGLDYTALENSALGMVNHFSDTTQTGIESAFNTENDEWASALSAVENAGGDISDSLIDSAAAKLDELGAIGTTMGNSITDNAVEVLSKGIEADVPIKLNIIDPRTPEEKALSGLGIDYVIPNGSAISPNLPTLNEEVFIGPVKGNATGSAYTSDTFIAGERGAELITNAAGSRVFNALETRGILGTFSRLAALFVEMGSEESSMSRYDTLFNPSKDSALIRFNKAQKRGSTKSSYEINFNPQINIDGNNNNATDIRQQIMSVLNDCYPDFVQLIKDVNEDILEREMRLSNA